MKLKEYKSRRNFKQTPEPKPGRAQSRGRLRFVVQKHSSRRLHYDLRLELDGVLKSWAVPRGPTLNPAIRRLAVMVEDHPLDYRTFEGVIPQGSYGAGTVIIWDQGFYHHPAAKDRAETERLMREGLKKGHITFILEGKKLRGEFALIKTRFSEKSWLLLKTRDSHATVTDVLKDNRSAASHKTLEDVLKASPEHNSDPGPREQIRVREAIEKEGIKDIPKSPMPRSVKPMLATLVKEPFDDPDWVFEVKWDGYRAIAEVRNGPVALYSRNSLPLESRFPQIVQSLKKLKTEAVLDGEVVVVDEQGRSNFQMLQDYARSKAGHLVYYVFDILYLHGHDLTGLPLLRRQELLRKILPSDPHLRVSGHIQKNGTAFFRAARKQGLEGIMAKRAQSRYRMGKRTRDWLKVKTLLSTEAVIIGFTAPRGSRAGFGALALGALRGRELVYIGNVGTGFNTQTLKEIHSRLLPLVRSRSPFRTEPAGLGHVFWVRPKLVCEVAFHGWTGAGLMRQPVFMRLRPDKSPREVKLELSLAEPTRGK